MQLLQLIQLYFYVCEVYEEELKWHCQRFTKNEAMPKFTDQELLSSYLFCVGWERRFQVSDLHRCLQDHYLSWFPHLPSYQAYNKRLNRLAAVFPVLVAKVLDKWQGQSTLGEIPFTLTDSMPIITCHHSRKAKVARELCDKGYNSTKKMHYYGVKLHAIGVYQARTLPVAEYLQLSAASEHDLTAQHPCLESLCHRVVVADKAFHSNPLKRLFAENGGELLTPVKYTSNQGQADKQRHLAADRLYSKAVSSKRQAIETFFSWLQQHTQLQQASKVRSTKGLLVHVFGKLAAALIFHCPAFELI